MKLNEKRDGVILSYIQMALNVLVKFIYTPFLLRALGQNEYGLFSLVMSIVGYLSILDFGFGSTVTRYVVEYRTSGDKDKLYKLYGTLSVIYIIIGIIALFVCIGLSVFASSLFGATMTDGEISKLKLMIVLVGVNLLFAFPLQISSSVIVAYEKFIFRNGINLLRTIFQPALMILLLYLVNMKAVGAIVVVTSFNLLTYLVYYLYSVFKLGFRFSISQFDSGLIKSLIGFSAWMFLMMVFEQLQFNSGQFILALFQGTEIVAVWGIAMIFVLNYRSLSTAVSNVFAPSIMSLSFKKDFEGVSSTICKIVRVQSIILFWILVNFIIFGRTFLEIWAGDSYLGAYKCALIMMIPMTLSLILDFSYLSQMAEKKLLYRTVTTFSCLFLSFFVIYLLFGINLDTFAYSMGISILTGQIISVIIYIKKWMKVSLAMVFVNIFKVALPILVVAGLGYYLFSLKSVSLLPDTTGSIMELILEAIVVNVFIFVAVWFFSLNKGEKQLIYKRG